MLAFLILICLSQTRAVEQTHLARSAAQNGNKNSPGESVTREEQVKSNSDTQNEERKPAPDHASPWLCEPTACFSAALVLFAMLQTIALFVQGRYMRKALIETKKSADAAQLSADIANKTMQRSERADVSVIEVRFQPPPLDSKLYAIIGNSGRKRTTCSISGILQAETLIRSITPFEQTLSEKSREEVPLQPVEPFSDEDMRRIHERVVSFGVSLTIQYKDGFGAECRLLAVASYRPNGFVITQAITDCA